MNTLTYRINIQPTQISEFSTNFGFCSKRIHLVALCWRNPWHCSTGGAHVPTAIVMRGGTVTQTCRSVQSKCRILYLLPQSSRATFILTSVHRTNNNDLLKLSNIHSYTILPHHKMTILSSYMIKIGNMLAYDKAHS
jgi:hypothetical protein